MRKLLLTFVALTACSGEYVIGNEQPLTVDPCSGACTVDQECVADAGVCRAKTPAPRPCGGNSLLTCATNETCVVDPGDACHTSGATDCPGFCQPKQPKACGGNSLLTCDVGQTCVVDLGDACHTGGATDCPGTCR